VSDPSPPPALSCQEQSLAIGEPLAGTAAAARHWLMLEHDGPWGSRGLEDSGLAAEVVAHLSELGRAYPSLRSQLVRRPNESPGSCRLFLAACHERGGALSRLVLRAPDELLELPLAQWLGGGAMPGEALSEPMYFVCVHGKRDRCCARLGMPLFRALDSEVGERAFQTTHLGGHRFAATLIELPSGLCYGRVPEVAARPLVEAGRRGEIYDLSTLRGRASYASDAQAAEVLLRSELAGGRTLPLALLGVDAGEGGSVVRFRDASGREHAVRVERAKLPPAPQSCGAAPKSAEQLIPLRVSAEA
jgi:hypothetical protein